MALNFTRVWRREHLQSTNCKVNRKQQNPDLKENVSDFSSGEMQTSNTEVK